MFSHHHEFIVHVVEKGVILLGTKHFSRKELIIFFTTCFQSTHTFLKTICKVVVVAIKIVLLCIYYMEAGCPIYFFRLNLQDNLSF